MKYDIQNFIGVFDSGIGGISVLNELLNLMPDENYIYFADSANFPYGKKSKSELVNIGQGIIGEFANHNAKSIVIACNTMSTSDMPSFSALYPNIKMFGTFPSFTHIFKPGLTISEDNISFDRENGLKINRDKKKLLIIATTSTCKSKFLNDLIKETNGLMSIYVEPADFIAKAVERNGLDSYEFNNELKSLLNDYLDIDYLMLGCTHFPFALNKIKSILGDKVQITSSCETTASNCYKYLSDNNLLNNSQNAYIKIIDYNINDEKKELYQNLINTKGKSHTILFGKTF